MPVNQLQVYIVYTVSFSLLEMEQLGMSCILRNENVKVIILHWSSGQDLLAVLKPTPLLPHAKMLLVPIHFFFLRVDQASRLCSRRFYVFTEQV